MGATLLTQDFVSICLVFAQGDIDQNIGNIIHLAEKYQDKHHCHLGVTPDDFRGMFRKLISWELGIKGFFQLIDDIQLKDIIPEILKYHDVYCNDEGEHWMMGKEVYGEDIRHLLAISQEDYMAKVAIKREMICLFSALPSICEVKEFMDKMNITHKLNTFLGISN